MCVQVYLICSFVKYKECLEMEVPASREMSWQLTHVTEPLVDREAGAQSP